MKSLTRKMDTLSQDIYSLLEKSEPRMLIWREIRNILWERYEKRYKDIKSFGVALSSKLRRLEDKKLIKQEGDVWGTLQAVKMESQKATISQIRSEMNKIRKDYLQMNTNQAYRRLTLLVSTILPKDMRGEIQTLINEQLLKYDKIDDELKINGYARFNLINRLVIIDVLTRLNEMLEKATMPGI